MSHAITATPVFICGLTKLYLITDNALCFYVRFVVTSIVNSKTAAKAPRFVRYLELTYPAITSPPHTSPLRATERLTQGHRAAPCELGIQNDTRSPLRASQRAAFREGLTTATSLTFSPLFEIH